MVLLRPLAIVLALCFLAAPALHADEAGPEGRLRVRLMEGRLDSAEPVKSYRARTPLRTVWYEGESTWITLVLETERWLDGHAVQRFRRELDLPLEISAPWLDPVVPEGEFRDPLVGPVTTSLNGNSATGLGAPYAWSADSSSAGPGLFNAQSWSLSAYGGRVHFDVVGTRSLTVDVRLTYADTFEEDFLGKRVPKDPKEHRYDFAATQLEVRSIPQEGRPAEYAGLLGAMELDARLVPMSNSDRIELRVLVIDTQDHPTGNLGQAALPLAEQLEGFHVFGVRDDQGVPRRTLVFELAPDHAGVTSVPPLQLVSFDPIAQAFVTRRTKPLPLPQAVLANAAAAPNAVGGKPVVTPVEVLDDTECLLACGIIFLVLLVSLGYVGFRLWDRRRHRAQPGSADDRKARAWAALVLDCSDTHLAEYLAATLDSPRAALVDEGLESRLINEAGFAPPLALQCAETFRALLAERYGGEPVSAEDKESLLCALGAAQRCVDGVGPA